MGAVGTRMGAACSSDIVRYQEVVAVPDVLVREVPDEVLAAIDAHAARLGLSRNEYLRRRLRQDAQHAVDAEIGVEDLIRFGERFSDLGDETVMRRAWS